MFFSKQKWRVNSWLRVQLDFNRTSLGAQVLVGSIFKFKAIDDWRSVDPK